MTAVHLHVFSVAPYYRPGRIWAAVPAPTAGDAIDRLQRDDDVWDCPSVRCHGAVTVDSAEYTSDHIRPHNMVIWYD